MRLHVRIVWAIASVLVACGSPAWASVPQSWFDEGIRDDIAGDTHAAFEAYLRAAQAGVPAAEFNIAVMLDSGRGVPSNIEQAATWYARAASRGNRRAAYNLGQLYEEGQGVPKNTQIARAWFEASGLEAAKSRLSSLRARSRGEGTLASPALVAPGGGAKVNASIGGVELVWTCKAQPEPARYYVEMRELNASGSHEVFSKFVETSSVLAVRPEASRNYAWRVLAVTGKAGRYRASDWQTFSTLPDEK